MSAEHFVTLAGLIITAGLLTHLIRRAISRNANNALVQASSTYRAQIDQLGAQLHNQAHLQRLDQLRTEEEHQRITLELDDLRKFKRETSTATLTKQDMQTLLDIVATLDMAHQTWLPMRGTEPWRAKAAAQIKSINTLANRVLDSLHSASRPVVVDQGQPGKAA
jgi:hypothetical protein